MSSDKTNIELKDPANWRPSLGYLIIRQWMKADTDTGPIIDPSADKTELAVGEVIKAGKSKAEFPYEPSDYEGKIVLFTDYAPTKTEIMGDDIIMLKASDVMAIRND